MNNDNQHDAKEATHLQISFQGGDRGVHPFVCKLREFIETVEESNDIVGESFQLSREVFGVEIF